ncbi:MAG: hypothetical protein ACYC4Q_07800 [Victivallaceae bacterium]
MNVDAEIIKAVDKLCGTTSLPIYPEDICEEVCDRIGFDSDGIPPDIIEYALEEEGDNYVAVYNSEEDDAPYFFSRRGLFDQAQFCIRPSALEIEQGILIPGHRFIPFFNRDSEVKLVTGVNSTKIKKTKRQIALSKLRIYYSLFGPKGMMELISAENEDNMFTFMEELKHGGDGKNTMSTVSAYDFKDFYAANKIVEGDMLLLSVINYKKQLCSIERLPDDRLWQSAKWESMFEEGLRESIEIVDQLGEMEPIEAFLSRAFFLSDHSLLESPSSMPVNLLNKRDYLSLDVSESGSALIWEKDREFDLMDMDDWDEEELESDENFPDEEESGLDKLLQIMGFATNDEELAAYMRDELFSGGNSLDNVKKRCLDNRIEQHYPDLQKEFNKEILSLWKTVKKEYNIFRDNPQGKIRKKGLEILDAHTEWIRTLDSANVTPDRQLESKLKEIMQVIGPVTGLVLFLNTEQKLSQKEVHNYSTMLEVAIETHARMIRDINAMLGIE